MQSPLASERLSLCARLWRHCVRARCGEERLVFFYNSFFKIQFACHAVPLFRVFLMTEMCVSAKLTRL